MKRLLLLGGGHAHVHVLSTLAQQPLAGWDVQLMTPYTRQIYSGMLPGWVAGHYAIDNCAIDLAALAHRAGVTLHQTAATHLDAAHQQVHAASAPGQTAGTLLGYDLLSIDTGPVAATTVLPGAALYSLPVRPIEQFIAAWPDLVARLRARNSAVDLVVLGAGAAGLELAFAIQYRAQREGWQLLRLHLLGSDELPLPGAPPALRRRSLALLRQRGIQWHGGQRVDTVYANHLLLGDGSRLAMDACLSVTGAAAPTWPQHSGLALDAAGFISVGPSLQSVSHPNVLAAGDVASYADPRPKSGVFAVRAGPVLARNLRALAAGDAPTPWTPQRRALYLISTGAHHALAHWGPLSWGGDWVWRWKDHIDRDFVRRYSAAP
jgi:selenide,water dikinase